MILVKVVKWNTELDTRNIMMRFAMNVMTLKILQKMDVCYLGIFWRCPVFFFFCIREIYKCLRTASESNYYITEKYFLDNYTVAAATTSSLSFDFLACYLVKYLPLPKSSFERHFPFGWTKFLFLLRHDMSKDFKRRFRDCVFAVITKMARKKLKNTWLAIGSDWETYLVNNPNFLW
jgi:hypothetical protein